MVARQEHGGDGIVPPHLRPGVLGIFQRPGPVALVLEAGLLGQNTGDHAADGIGDGHSSQLAAGENKISQGEFLVHIGVDKALIHPFIVAADQDEPLPGQQLPGLVLVKDRARGAEEDGVDVFSAGDVVHAAGQGLALHDHSLTAAIGIIVGAAALVGGIVPDVVAADVQETGFPSPADDAGREGGIHHLREKGEDVNSHRAAFPRWWKPRSGGPPGGSPGGRAPRQG